MTLLEIDTSVFHFFNNYHNPTLDQLSLLIHYATRGGIVYYPFAFALLLTRKKQLQVFAKLGIIGGVGAFFTTELILKNIFDRLRPYEFLNAINYIPPAPDSFSFPSGQTATAFVIAMIVFLLFRKKSFTYLAFTWAIIVGLSRIYMGHHYPSDVIAGALIGSMVGYITWKILHKKLTRPSH